MIFLKVGRRLDLDHKPCRNYFFRATTQKWRFLINFLESKWLLNFTEMTYAKIKKIGGTKFSRHYFYLFGIFLRFFWREKFRFFEKKIKKFKKKNWFSRNKMREMQVRMRLENIFSRRIGKIIRSIFGSSSNTLK